MPDSLATLIEDGKSIVKDSDTGEVTAGTLAWAVATSEQAVAEADPKVPDQGDEHPEYPKLTCDRVGFAWESGSIVATAQYSNDGRFAFPAFTSAGRKPGWYQWREEYREYEYDIPYAVKIKEKAALTGQPVSRWEPRAFHISKERRTIEVLEVLLTATGPRQFRSANAEVGNIHKFGGEFWQMIGFTTSQQSDTTVSVIYEWMIDLGTLTIPNPVIPGEEEIVFFTYGANTFPFDPAPATRITHTRLPYERLEAQELGGGRKPVIVSYLDAKAYAPNGWRNLPGAIEPR